MEPCTFAFPSGLGPFEIRRTRLQPHDLVSLGQGWALRDTFFQSSASLRQCWDALLQNGVAMEGAGGQRYISVQLSPLAPISLSQEVREANRIPDLPGVMVAFMSALQLEWSMILSMIDTEETSPEWSFLKLGGFLYFTAQHEVICGNTIAFHPSGSMQFSAAQPWCSEWTLKLARRFQKAAASKGSLAHVEQSCWAPGHYTSRWFFIVFLCLPTI